MSEPALSLTDKSQPAPAKRRNRQAEVIDAAIDIFYRKGYSAAAIQDVAEAVGVLKGSLYYYIASKEDLLFRICESVHDESTKILDEVLALDLQPLERVRTYIERHVRWYLENTQQVGVFFREWRFLTGERFELVAQHRRGYDRTIRELIHAAQETGEVDPGISEKYASFYILAAVNAVPEWYRPGGRDSAQSIAEAYANLTIGMLTGTHENSPEPAR